MNPVFSYTDYRNYIRDYYQFRKKSRRSFSYRAFSHDAGFKSPVFIKLVIESKSNLSPQSAVQLAKAMGLDDVGSAYFRMLVDFNQARNDDAKRDVFLKLSSFMKKLKTHIVEEDNYTYYDKWYYSAIRELISFPAFRDNPSGLGEALVPALGKREVNQALKVLEANGFIAKNADGSFRQTNKHVTTGSEITSLAVRNFHKLMGRQAIEAIDHVAKEERDFSGLTLGISAAKVDVLREELAAFRRRIIQLAAEDGQAELVYRLNLQLFPLSRIVPAGDGKESSE